MKNSICNFAFDLSVNFLQELSEEIEDYTQRFNTEDQLEWNLVLQEVAAFVEVMTPSLKCNLKCKSVFCFGVFFRNCPKLCLLQITR